MVKSFSPTKIELAPARKHNVTASGDSCLRPAANRTLEAGIKIRAVAIARTISRGSSAGVDASVCASGQFADVGICRVAEDNRTEKWQKNFPAAHIRKSKLRGTRAESADVQ